MSLPPVPEEENEDIWTRPGLFEDEGERTAEDDGGDIAGDLDDGGDIADDLEADAEGEEGSPTPARVRTHLSSRASPSRKVRARATEAQPERARHFVGGIPPGIDSIRAIRMAKCSIQCG